MASKAFFDIRNLLIESSRDVNGRFFNAWRPNAWRPNVSQWFRDRAALVAWAEASIRAPADRAALVAWLDELDAADAAKEE
jgi:hypothetical protein